MKNTTIKINKDHGDMMKFKLAAENAFDMIVITDKDGNIVFANKAAENITGYKHSEMIGERAGGRELWGGLMDEDYYAELWRVIRDEKKAFVSELKNRRKNGDIYDAEIKITPALDKKGNVLYYVSIERDITEQKKVDRAKTEFVSLASHQLRTPLSTISLSTDLILKESGMKLGSEQKSYLRDIQEDVFKMSELIESLLNISKIEMGIFMAKSRPIKMFEVIYDILDELGPLISNKKIIVREKIDANIPTIKTDRNIIRIVLQNLFANAVKYNQKGGKINVIAKKEKQNIIIKVQDNGIGIPREQQDKIFSKFFRTENAKKVEAGGSGLGLYIAKSLLKQIDGKIWFKSKINKGTTFYVSIPIKPGKKIKK